MRVALLGYGTVGRGVDEILRDRVPGVEVTRILELPGRITDKRMTADFADIENDFTVDLVVECMGGIEPAHEFICRSLKAKKHVVTSNKAVVAAHMREFVELSHECRVSFLFEAAVAGGIPWIASLEKVRRVDDISAFSGIMNGTTNFVIDSMRRNGQDFGEALGIAQELGYAEADPTADIGGFDVRNKTIISASVAFGVQCTDDIPVTGIENLRAHDLALLSEHGLTVKLFGRGVATDGAYACSVEPVAIPLDSLEAQVPLNFNLVTVEGATVGPLKFYGQGAGSLPTGNAIVQDIIDAQAGRTIKLELDRGLVCDPTLLTSDYVVRSSVAPAGAEPFGEGGWLVRDLSATDARALYVSLLEQDPSAFIAAMPKGD